jgi:hypothetical protein
MRGYDRALFRAQHVALPQERSGRVQDHTPNCFGAAIRICALTEVKCSATKKSMRVQRGAYGRDTCSGKVEA